MHTAVICNYRYRWKLRLGQTEDTQGRGNTGRNKSRCDKFRSGCSSISTVTNRRNQYWYSRILVSTAKNLISLPTSDTLVAVLCNI